LPGRPSRDLLSGDYPSLRPTRPGPRPRRRRLRRRGPGPVVLRPRWRAAAHPV